jgi:aminopeptidase N
MRRDPDAFNRWEAGQMLTRDVLREMIAAVQAGQKPKADPLYLESMGEVIARAGEDHAFAALMLIPPSELELAFAMDVIDPDAIHAARKALIVQIAAAHGPALASLYRALESNEAFSPDARSAGRRSLRNACLRFLTADDDAAAAALAHEHYSRATNMTDMMAGLAALARMTDSKRDAAFAHFHQRFASDPLVLDKWMGLQATSPSPDTLERVRALMKNPAFAINNPNRVRALIGAFAMANPLRFHAKDGAGYRLFREVLRALDPINPSTAARMATAFESWRRFDPERRALMRAELEAIAALPGISANLYEIVTRTLDSGTGKSPS